MFGLNGGKPHLQKTQMELGPADKWVLIVIRPGGNCVEQYGSNELAAEDAVAMLMGAASNVAITELRKREEFKSRIQPPKPIIS